MISLLQAAHLLNLFEVEISYDYHDTGQKNKLFVSTTGMQIALCTRYKFKLLLLYVSAKVQGIAAHTKHQLTIYAIPSDVQDCQIYPKLCHIIESNE